MSRSSSRMPGASISNSTGGCAPRLGWQMKVSIAPAVGSDVQGLLDHDSWSSPDDHAPERDTRQATVTGGCMGWTRAGSLSD
jgi:hypothetical protein